MLSVSYHRVLKKDQHTLTDSLFISGLKPDISPIVGLSRGVELSSRTGPVFENSVLNRTADPYFSPRFLKMFASASLLRRSAIAQKFVISSSRHETNKENLACRNVKSVGWGDKAGHGEFCYSRTVWQLRAGNFFWYI